MSLHNLLIPNNLDIFAKSITADTVNIDSVTMDDLEVNTIESDSITNSGQIVTSTLTSSNITNSGNVSSLTMTINGQLLTNVASQTLNSVTAKYLSGGVLGADIAGSTISIDIQTINSASFVHMNASSPLTNASGADAFIAYPLAGLNPQIIIASNLNQIVVVRQTAGSAIGKWKTNIIGGVLCLILMPNALDEGEFFANGASSIAWDPTVLLFTD